MSSGPVRNGESAAAFGGYAMLMAVVVLALMGIVGASLLTSPVVTGSRLAGMREESLVRRRMIEDLEEVLEAFRADETPLADSPGDPVWTVVEGGGRSGSLMELTDVSSAVNLNASSRAILMQDSLKLRYRTQRDPELVYGHLTREGTYLRAEEVEELIPEDSFGVYFTIYGPWNPFVSDADSLAAMIQERTGEDGASLAGSLLAATGSPNFGDSALQGLLGDDEYDLGALMTTRGVVNVHFADRELLRAVLDWDYGGEKLPNRSGALDALTAARAGREISASELSGMIEQKEDQKGVLRVLGTETWYWNLRIELEDDVLDVLIAKLPGLDDDGQTRHRVVSRRFGKTESS